MQKLILRLVIFSSPPFRHLLPSTPTVKASITSSKMELTCLYSETSHIQSANWRFQNNSRQLRLSSNGPGSISTMLPVPITSDVVGNYTCTLQLKNGQTISATQAVTLPYEGGRDNMVSQQTASFLFSLSLAYYNKGVLANFLSNQWRECTLNVDESSCVLSEAFGGASETTWGQFICQRACGLSRKALQTDTMFCFLDVVKEVTGQDLCVGNLQKISSWITRPI